jgi:metal-sulfur cluster biosynthetic enzyme
VQAHPERRKALTTHQQLTETAIFTALRDCYDSAFDLNIVDLGLVQSIAITPDHDAPGSGIPGVPPRQRVHIALILPSQADDVPSLIPALVSNRLAAFEAISHTEVEILLHPIWTPDLISTEGRQRLAANLNARRPSHELVQIKT